MTFTARCLGPKHKPGGRPCFYKDERCPVDKDCRFRHHRMLHDPHQVFKSQPSTGGARSGSATGGPVAYIAMYADERSDEPRHLRMLNVQVRIDGGPPVRTTCLLDSGSMRTLMSEKLALRIGAKLDPQDITLAGNSWTADSPMSKVRIQVAGQNGRWHPLQSEALPDLSVPGPMLKWSEWKKDKERFQRLPLEDVSYSDVEIIMGIEVEDLIDRQGRKVRSKDKAFSAYKTALGWTIAGPAQGMEKTFLALEHDLSAG